MIKNKKEIRIIILGFMSFLLVLSLISAIGLSLDYNDKNPLKVGPGETKEVIIGRLQNPDNESITLKLEIIEGADIAEVTSDTLTLPAKSLDTSLNLKISIPEGTPEGTKYKIGIKYADITSKNGTGMIIMTQSQTSSIPVLVQKIPVEPTPTAGGISTTTIIILIIGIIVVIAIILLLVKKKK